MNKYRVINPVSWGGRRERGEILELRDDQVKNISADCIELIGEAKGKNQVPEEFDIDTADKKSIVAELEKLGVEFKPNANADALRKTYKDFLKKKAEAEAKVLGEYKDDDGEGETSEEEIPDDEIIE